MFLDEDTARFLESYYRDINMFVKETRRMLKVR